MNCELMCQYIEFVADRLLVELGCPKQWRRGMFQKFRRHCPRIPISGQMLYSIYTVQWPGLVSET